jgi:hypothetical protein
MATQPSNLVVNAGATTVTAAVCMSLASAHARVYAIPLGLAGLAVIVWLARWNLARGGSAVLGNFLTLSGRKVARPRAPRPAADSTATTRSPQTPGHRGTSQAHAAPQSASRARAATAFILVLLAAAGASAFVGATGRPAMGATRKTPAKTAALAGPASVVYAYYTAVNDREWPKAWALSGQLTEVDGAAYSHWIDGYACTVRDHVTSITTHGSEVVVGVRAEESGGVIQTYRFSYVVRDGALTHPEKLSVTGRAPQGCGS